MNTDKKEYGISVIMPCYNTEQYVEETLKSVLNQSFKDYEIICFAKAMNIPTSYILDGPPENEEKSEDKSEN